MGGLAVDVEKTDIEFQEWSIILNALEQTWSIACAGSTSGSNSVIEVQVVVPSGFVVDWVGATRRRGGYTIARRCVGGLIVSGRST